MSSPQLTLGASATLRRTITDADIVLFAGVTGDTNPAHIDDVWAKNSRFGGRLAHGMLSAGLISAVLGTRLPGPGTVYLEQSLRFVAPVRPGDTISAEAVIAELLPKGRVRLKTTCVNQDGVTVLEGEALVIAPRPS